MIAKSTKETEKVAQIFLDRILNSKNFAKQKGALIVGLSGELGAGKTAFTQAIARHLGIKNKVISPTFVVIKKYPLALRRGSVGARGSEFKFLYHLDAYRLKDEKELLILGWEEIINNNEHLVFVEWPENVKKAVPADARHINISVNKNGHRNFKIK